MDIMIVIDPSLRVLATPELSICDLYPREGECVRDTAVDTSLLVAMKEISIHSK